MRTDNTYMLTSRPFYTFNFFVKKKISSLNKTMKFFFNFVSMSALDDTFY